MQSFFYRNRGHDKFIASHGEDSGIPQYYGIFYAMGMALIVEGVMSACYHVCPTSTNFQFGKCHLRNWHCTHNLH